MRTARVVEVGDAMCGGGELLTGLREMGLFRVHDARRVGCAQSLAFAIGHGSRAVLGLLDSAHLLNRVSVLVIGTGESHSLGGYGLV